MDDKKIVFSVVMPTYNSERTLEEALKNIRDQKFDQDKIEIIISDGGSTDRTREIAKKYNAIVVDNPERLPEPGKLYGMKVAQGEYLCIMGSDEIVTNHDIFQKRYDLFKSYPEVHGIIGELVAPKDYSPLCTYMNAVGDPFTCFAYKMKGNHIYNLRKHLYKTEGKNYIFSFKEDDIIPIGDGATVIDWSYVKEKYPKEAYSLESSILWDVLIRDTSFVGIIEDDLTVHMSKTDFKTYAKKLKFRIINNIHNVSGSGYAFRAQTQKKLNKRKYLYPFYCISIVLPIFDGILMAVRMKKAIFLSHPFWVLYVMVWICIEYLKKIVGIKSENKVYGG